MICAVCDEVQADPLKPELGQMWTLHEGKCLEHTKLMDVCPEDKCEKCLRERPDVCVTWRTKSDGKCAYFEGDGEERKPENCVAFDRFDTGSGCASVDKHLEFVPFVPAGA